MMLAPYTTTSKRWHLVWRGCHLLPLCSRGIPWEGDQATCAELQVRYHIAAAQSRRQSVLCSGHPRVRRTSCAPFAGPRVARNRHKPRSV